MCDDIKFFMPCVLLIALIQWLLEKMSWLPEALLT